MRAPIEILVVVCLIVGIVPAISIGPFLQTAVESVLGDRTPEYSLSLWHGFNIPLLMSLIALFGGFLLTCSCEVIWRAARTVRPYFRRLRGQRLFRARSRDGVVAVGPSGGGAARHAQSPAPVALDRCRRLHCRQLALYFSGFERRPSAVSAIDPAFGLLWLIGMALAIGAAVSAKYHRLPGSSCWAASVWSSA